MIIIKSDQEIELMRISGHVTGTILKELEDFIKPGISTADIDTFVETNIRKAGMIPTFLGYGGFPASACVSINEEVVHGIPDKKRILQEGDDLVCLARRFDISVAQLLSQNGIETPEEMGVGDTVLLPRSPNSWSMLDGYGRRILVLHPASYTIQNGDTLFSIACSYGDVRPEDIAVKNQLVLGEPLPVGLTIAIP